MPYLFGGLVLLNALALGYFLFVKQPATTQSLQEAQAQITQPLDFTNSAKHIPPPIGTKD